MSIIYEDDDGAKLHADLAIAGSQLRVYTVSDDSTVQVHIAALEGIVRELYRAAGKEAPLILPQPPAGELLAKGPHGDDLVTVTPSPARGAANLPGVLLQIGGDEANARVRLIGAEPMRVAGALINAMREAESEPDEAEVEKLAALMMSADQKRPLGADFNDLARAILRAGYGREA